MLKYSKCFPKKFETHYSIATEVELTFTKYGPANSK